MLIHPKVAIWGIHALAKVDYSVATKISNDVAIVSTWAFNNKQYWLIEASVHTLQTLDTLGSLLITLVVWLVQNAF